MKRISNALKMAAATLMAASLSVATVAFAADDWKPDGSLTMQIGFGAGGSTDTMGRVLAKVIEDQTGWNVIAENKTGGGGVAMFTGIAKMPPRGKVIGLGVNMPILVNLVNRGDELGFDLSSFDYLGTIAKAELALVASKDAPFDNLMELVAYAKEQGNMPVAFGAPPQKLLMDVTSRETGAKFNMVSTKGGAETMKLILGGQVLAGFGSGEQLPYLESGDMKIIAAANEERLSYAPDIETFREAGVNAYVDPYFFLAMTKGTPPEAVKAIAAAIDNAMKSPEMAEIVKNATDGSPLNLGTEGTEKMMVGGLKNVGVLFQK
ncbi:tripartite tricarboxylate transporter substrate binding protein [Hoeflea poritis]|uniref:Tripartite tricarboxylate transporter substrate binding protein n=1 Tax=Hoeflea poritis TaxID=2993659 RepID=A0ABT4VT72_9HYPH|nr:tripartite tricarboxylate transporter substrate binding protein [Hoeflea poritis]MDA4847911.1 tripartite tricarboxylate transporter substrate binding protein [Hoeflea poritis]